MSTVIEEISTNIERIDGAYDRIRTNILEWEQGISATAKIDEFANALDSREYRNLIISDASLNESAISSITLNDGDMWFEIGDEQSGEYPMYINTEDGLVDIIGSWIHREDGWYEEDPTIDDFKPDDTYRIYKKYTYINGTLDQVGFYVCKNYN